MRAAFLKKIVAGVLCASAMFFAVANPAFAAAGVPNIISYQGRLTSSAGTLLGGAGTLYQFKFSIWDSATVGAGTKLWPAGAPGTTTISVVDGVFNVNIGDTANGYPDTLNYNFQDTDTAYLQIEVSSDAVTFETLGPRQRIMSSATAINAQTLQGLTPGTGANNLLKLGSNGEITLAGGGTSTLGNVSLGTVSAGTWQGDAIADQYITKTGNWLGTFAGQTASYYLDAGNLTNFSVPFNTAFSTKTTDDLAQGSTNKYYSTSLFNTDFGNKTTDDLAQGGINKYYSTSLFNTDLATKTTDDIAEGSTNKYFTNTIFDTAFGLKSTTNLTEGTNLYFTTARVNTAFDARLATKNTDALAEGVSNLYFSNARAVAALAGLYESPLTFSGPLTRTSNTISLAQATSSAPGFLSAADFATFNAKQSALVSGTNIKTINSNSLLGSGNITIASLIGYTPYNATNPNGYVSNLSSFSTTNLIEGTNLYFNNTRARNAISVAGLPLTYDSSTGVLGINQASGAQAGYLSSTDWSTFNSKQDALPVYTPGSILFGDGTSTPAQNNTNFFWDATSVRLGIGTNTPSAKLETITSSGTGDLAFRAGLIASDSGNYDLFAVDAEGYFNSQSIYDDNAGNVNSFSKIESSPNGNFYLRGYTNYGVSPTYGGDTFVVEQNGALTSYGNIKDVQSGLGSTYQFPKVYSSASGAFALNGAGYDVGGIVQTGETLAISPSGTLNLTSNLYNSSAGYIQNTTLYIDQNGNLTKYGVFDDNTGGIFQTQTMYSGSTGQFVLGGLQNFGNGYGSSDTLNIDNNGGFTLQTASNDGSGNIYNFNPLEISNEGSFYIKSKGISATTNFDRFSLDTNQDVVDAKFQNSRLTIEATGTNQGEVGLWLTNPTAATDSGNWAIQSDNNGVLYGRVWNDARDSSYDWLTVERNSYHAQNIALQSDNEITLNAPTIYTKTILPSIDDTYSLGDGSLRFNNIYAANGNIDNLIVSTINGVAPGGGSGTVTSFAFTNANGFTGSVSNSTTTPTLSLSFQNASGSQDGQLTATDWNTFNNKFATPAGTTLQYVRGDGSLATLDTNYEAPLTFSTGLTRSANTITNNLSTGVSGGQSVVGGTASGDNLTLSSTSNATKGNILFGNSAYDEANNRLAIGVTSFDGVNPEKLLVQAGTTTSVNVISAKGTINSYLQMNLQNQSSGTNASSDIVATADNGNETTNFINMGINSSGYTGGVFGGANDAYLYNLGQNMLIGTGTASKSLIFMTGGTSQASNERMRIDGSGNIGIGTTTPSSKLDITTNALGVTQTATSGLALVNTTAAVLNFPQISPAIRFSGQGWGSTAGASQDLSYRMYSLTSQGGVVNGNLVIESSANGGAYNKVASFASGGTFSVFEAGTATARFSVAGANRTDMYFNGMYLTSRGSSILARSGSAADSVSFTNAAGITSIATSGAQFVSMYDNSNYFSTTVSSTGSTTFALAGTTPNFTFTNTGMISMGTSQTFTASGSGYNGGNNVGLLNIIPTFTDTNTGNNSTYTMLNVSPTINPTATVGIPGGTPMVRIKPSITTSNPTAFSTNSAPILILDVSPTYSGQGIVAATVQQLAPVFTNIQNNLGSNTMFNIAPSITGTNAPNGNTGTFRGVYYNPTYNDNLIPSASSYAWQNTKGMVLVGTTSGNLGVGTTTPTSLLQVNQPTTGMGVVTNTAGGTTVTGFGTQFTNTFKVGDTITIGGQTVAISAIASDTSMTTAAITNANTSAAYTLTGGTRFSVKGGGPVIVGGSTYVNGMYGSVPSLYVNGYTLFGSTVELPGTVRVTSNATSFRIGQESSNSQGNALFNAGADTTGIYFGNYLTNPVRLQVGNSDKLSVFNTGNVSIGTTSDTAARLGISGGITASSNIARGVYLNNTLTNATTSDSLIALDIQPTFTNTFTRYKNLGLKIGTSYAAYDTYANALNLSAEINGSVGVSGTLNVGGDSSVINLWRSGAVANGATIGATYTSPGTGHLYFQGNSGTKQMVLIGSNGNLIIQNGGTFTDSGHTLQVTGSVRATTSAYFATSSGSVGIGTASPATKLHVVGTTGTPEVLRIANEGNATHTTFNFYNANSDPSSYRNIFSAYESRGTLASPTALVNGDQIFTITGVGHDGTAYKTNSSLDFIVDGAVSTNIVPIALVYKGTATSSARAEVFRISSNGKVGINGIATNMLSVVGLAGDTTVMNIGTTSGNNCSFSTTTGAWSCASDIRLKHDVLSITPGDALTKLNLLNPITFRYNWQAPDEAPIAGFIAQEFETVFPELVHTDATTGYKSLSYAPLMPYAIKAIQELDIQIRGISPDALDATASAKIKAFLTDVTNNIIHIKDLFAETVHVEKGLEIKDQATGTIYCVVIQNGDWVKTPGTCDAPIVPAPAADPVITPDPTPDPVPDPTPAPDPASTPDPVPTPEPAPVIDTPPTQ